MARHLDTTSSANDVITAANPSAEASTGVPAEQLRSVLHDLYLELLEGMPEATPTWVTSGGPEGGVYGTLADISAERASADVGGISIAAHAEHLRWAMAVDNQYFAGHTPRPDWSASWSVREVDGPAWDQLRADLHRTGDELLQHLATRTDWVTGPMLKGVLTSYAHAAYHLGSLRLLAKRTGGDEHGS